MYICLTKEKIQEMFRLSEVFTASGEAITPFYKVRENVEQFQIKEEELREYLLRYTPKNITNTLGRLYRKFTTRQKRTYKKEKD